MVAIKIEGSGYAVGKVFSDTFSFNIPNYQRPYAWTTEQTEQLLSDLLDAAGNNSGDISEIPPYFLGNIVLIKSPSKSESEVVDGQQRLTTLTILFAVLKKLVPQYKDHLEKYICQPEDPLENIPARPRLILRERDREFFEKYIQNSGGLEKIKEDICLAELSDSQLNIVENTRLLLNRIKNDLPKDQEKIRLTQFLLQRCFLVIVHTPDFDSAYRIFSVLNDRGLDLSITDILKADIIGKLKNDEEKYTCKWEDLEEQLGRKDFTELFSHIRMIYARKKLETTVLKSFRTHVLDKEGNKDPQHLINNVIKPYAEALYDIKNCSYISDREDYAEKINQLFRWLQRIDHFDWISPGILYLKQYRHKPEQLLTFFTCLERLAAGLMIQRSRVADRIRRYAEIIRNIEQNSNSLYNSDSPLQLNQQEQKEIIDRLNGDIYNKYKTRGIRLYILLRLDSFISDNTPNYDSYKRITIEHVLPQNPDSDSQWLKCFPIKEEREKYVHRLGNLVLLSRQKNSQASNYDFHKKKEKYFKRPVATFALTIQVINEQEWTPTIMENHQRDSLENLKQIWQLNDYTLT